MFEKETNNKLCRRLPFYLHHVDFVLLIFPLKKVSGNVEHVLEVEISDESEEMFVVSDDNEECDECVRVVKIILS